MQYSISKRPRLLTDIKGQEGIIKDLMKRQMNYNWPTAMLFKGLHGLGKTTTAMAVAMAIQCKNINEVGEPCQTCDSCKSIMEERYDRDTHMIDGALLGKKDYVTDKLDLVSIAPLQDPKRLFLIEEADQLTPGAINAFHKILEKPRKNVHFILLSMSNNIPPSIQSRCLPYNFKPFSVKDVMVNLKELMIEEDKWDDPLIPNSFRLEGLASIANSSKGLYRDAVRYLERCLTGGFYTAEAIQENLGIIDESSVIKMLFAFLDKDTSAWFDLARIDPNEIYNLILTVMTDAYIYKMSGVIMNEAFASQTKKLAAHKNFSLLLLALNALRESSKTYLRKSDLMNVLANYWGTEATIIAKAEPLITEREIPTRKRRGE